jgi:hypothetical protein
MRKALNGCVNRSLTSADFFGVFEMKARVLTGLVTGLLFASTAFATELNLTVTRVDDGLGSVTVGPGCAVNYQVKGQLSDAVNDGLALFGFDLELQAANQTQAAPLTKANVPTTTPMSQFVIPLGISNPGTDVANQNGYGGTEIGGKLVQCGGGTNTIRNTMANADFPVDPSPPLGVAKGGQQVVLTGSLFAPMADGTYTLVLNSVFGNVVKQGETLADPFLETLALGSNPTISNLTITVQTGASCSACAAALGLANPPNNTIDARFPHAINDKNVVFGFDSVTIDMPACAVASGVNAGMFTVTETGGTPAIVPTVTMVTPVDSDTVTLTLSHKIEPKAWTVIALNGTSDKICLGFLPADVNGSRGSNAQDITAIVNAINGAVPRPTSSTDINRSGGNPNAQDITAVVNLLNGAAEFDVWLNQTLVASPCPP